MQYKKSRIYIEDIKRAIGNGGFFMGTMILTVILMRTVVGYAQIPGKIPVMEICSLPMALSGFTIFSAAFPSWAYADQYYKERKHNYDYFIASRMTWKRYGIMRIISVGISGGLIMAIPIGIVFVFSCLVGSMELGSLFGGMKVREVIQYWGIPAVLCMKIYLGFLFGVFWALIGFLSSFLIRNKYAPFLIPFILNQFFWVIFKKYPKINPIFLVRGEDLDSYGGSALILTVYCMVIALMIYLFFCRKEHE